MAVLKMQRISICALKKDRKAILEKLQSLGVVEINHVIEEDEDFKKMDTAGQKAGFEKASTLAEQAIDILDKYVPEKKSMFASLEGKALIEREEEERIRNERSIESLNPWISLDVPLTPAETDRTAVFFGTMPGGTDAETVYGILAEKAPDITGADVNIVSSEPGMVYLAVVCMKEDVQAAEDALRSAGFARPSQMWGDVPKFQKEELESEIADCRARIEQIENEVKDLSDQREKLKILADYYRVRADKYAVLGQIPQSERTFVISGYIPQCEAAHLSGYLTEKYDCMVDVEELQENEEAPVILKNNPFSASVEGVVESYGLPHKGELDPTTIMSFFYVFFFGMMLSDAAYGAIVAIVCAVLVKKFPRMSQGMKKSMKLFFYCGLSTLVWGILFGGYFGNIVDVVSEKFFGTTITVPALWFVPLNDPMKLLVFSLLFGVIHLFVGLGIKGYLCLKDGKVMDFFCDVVLWFMLLIGLILMLLPSDIFASIA
ncbi:MAG: V-type ATP synthase subunit I, partial [Clostridiales bacterium 44_9]